MKAMFLLAFIFISFTMSSQSVKQSTEIDFQRFVPLRTMDVTTGFESLDSTLMRKPIDQIKDVVAHMPDNFKFTLHKMIEIQWTLNQRKGLTEHEVFLETLDWLGSYLRWLFRDRIEELVPLSMKYSKLKQ